MNDQWRDEDPDDIVRLLTMSTPPDLGGAELQDVVLRAGHRRRTVRRITSTAAPLGVAAALVAGFMLWSPGSNTTLVPPAKTSSSSNTFSPTPGPVVTATATATPTETSRGRAFGARQAPSASPSTSASPSSTPAAVDVSDRRVLIANDTVLVVSRSTGQVLQKLAKVPNGRGIRWAAVDSEGTVFALHVDREGGLEGVLARVDAAGFHEVQPYVTRAAMSPSRTRIAYSFLSPDGNGDGLGMVGIRTMTIKNKDVTTLQSSTYPVTGPGVAEIDAYAPVMAWTNASRLVLNSSRSGPSTTLISSTTPTASLPTPVSPNGAPMGVDAAGNVLALGDKPGVDGVWVKISPSGASTVLGDYVSLDPPTADVIRAQGFEPLTLSSTEVKYQPVDGLVDVWDAFNG